MSQGFSFSRAPPPRLAWRSFREGLWWYIPRRRLLLSTAGSGQSRVRSTAACGGLPLTARPGCATPPGAAGDISSRAAPFPWIGKGRGDRVEPLPRTAAHRTSICRSEGMPYKKPSNRYFTITTGSMGARPYLRTAPFPMNGKGRGDRVERQLSKYRR